MKCEAKTEKEMRENRTRRTERGWAGHFICGHRCRFHRNTLLENGNQKIVVSTVGAYFPKDKLETIGCERHYETMAFHAKREGEYWDADVERLVEFKALWSLKITKRNEGGTDNLANEMHESVVEEIEAQMKAGRDRP